MRNEFDMSKCQKTVFFAPILDHPSVFQRWGPCAPCTRGGAKHPSIQIAMALEHVSCDQKSLKNRKNATFRKLFRSHWRVLKSLRSTLRAPRTSQEHVLKLFRTFHFWPFFDQKWRDPELPRNIPNIKRSNFEASPALICSIFPEEFENGD